MGTKNANILIINIHGRAKDQSMGVQKFAFRKKHNGLIINTHERAMDGQKKEKKQDTVRVFGFSTKTGIENATDFAEKLSNQSIAPGAGGFMPSAPVFSAQKNANKRNVLKLNTQWTGNGRAMDGQKTCRKNIKETPKQERRPINVKKIRYCRLSIFFCNQTESGFSA